MQTEQPENEDEAAIDTTDNGGAMNGAGPHADEGAGATGARDSDNGLGTGSDTAGEKLKGGEEKQPVSMDVATQYLGSFVGTQERTHRAGWVLQPHAEALNRQICQPQQSKVPLHQGGTLLAAVVGMKQTVLQPGL